MAIPNNHIECTEGTRGGRPRISGTRITVDDVVMMHQRLGQSPDEIASTYDLTLSGVYAAMAYYFEHQKEIDARIDADDAYVEAMARQNPSKLQAKLRGLRRE